jgi:pimeloyl-ACP methyl ester carboxylesterase
MASASFGAYLARGVVYQRGFMMDGLLMVVPTTVVEDAKRVLPRRRVIVGDASLGDRLPPEHQQLWRDYVVVQDRAVLASIQDGLIDTPDTAAAAWLSRIRDDPRNYALPFDVNALPAPFPAPALIIAGRQDNVVGYAQAWPLLEDYPRATFAVLDRAGHLLETEQPQLFAALVREWLERVREAQG